MPVFSNTEELYKIMTELWKRIGEDSIMAPQLLKSKLIVQFHYRDPEGRLTVDCSDGQKLTVYTGESNVKPIVEMFMKTDVAHQFWLGKVNVPMAILSGKIISKGPVNKALALLPIIKPAFAIYPSLIVDRETKAASKN